MTNVKSLPIPNNQPKIETETPFFKLQPNQKAAILGAKLGNCAVNQFNELHRYAGGVWKVIDSQALYRHAVNLFDKNLCPFSKSSIDAVTDTLKIMLPTLQAPRRDVIGFRNGVYSLTEQTFEPHSPDNWLLSVCDVDFNQQVSSDSLSCPVFEQWLDHASKGQEQKRLAIEAGLYMVLTNRYDWQLFLEVTGEGGSGKSVFTSLAELLSGGQSIASTMRALDDPKERYSLIGKNLITLPDQSKYVGDGAGIKSITGGDSVMIRPLYNNPFSAVINAVIIATNNNPMIFTERNGGIARRRVVLAFDNVVEKSKRDPQLISKLTQEIPAIVSRLFNIFKTPSDARATLELQRGSQEALDVKKQSDHVLAFVGYLTFMEVPHGLYFGGCNAGWERARRFVYRMYIDYCNYVGVKHPLSAQQLSTSIKSSAKEYGSEYLTRLVKGRTQTNIQASEDLINILSE